MIRLRQATTAPWMDGHLDGVVRDDRKPLPDDGLLPGAAFSFGDDMAGPSVMMSITRRLYPKKAPVHLHKTDTFRMALGEPIVVGRRRYAHGEFRLQEIGTYYGPELWNDETGTNQVLVMADRRGGKPYLTTPELQALSDMGRSAEEDLGEGYRQHDRDAEVHHEIRNNFGATIHAGHWDGGFTDTAAWPVLGDGSRLGVITMGPPESGPAFLCWDRPAGVPELPGFTATTDLVRLVIEGSVVLGDDELPRLGFRLQQADTAQPPSRPGTSGLQELWLFADRRGIPSLGAEIDAEVASVTPSSAPA